MLYPNLKSFVRNIQVKYWLLLIIFIAFLLRVNRIDIGFPGLFVSNDEAILHQSALNMLASKTPFTLGNYGPLGSYIQIPFLVLAFLVMLLQGTVSGIKGLELLLLTQEGYLLFVPRAVSVMFGTLSVLIIFKISLLLFRDKRAALWSAFFAAFSFNLVLVSHLARTWSPSIFFSLLAVYFAIKSTKQNLGFSILLSFVFAAVSFGFHQISGIIIMLVILVHILHFKKGRIYRYLIGFVCWGLLVMLFNFLSLGSNFLSALTPGNPTVGLVFLPKNVLSLTDWLNFFWSRNYLPKVTLDLILTDGVIVLLSLFFFLKKQNCNKLIAVIGCFTLLNYLVVSTVVPPFIRYFLISFAFLPVFAGKAFTVILKKRPAKILALFVISIACFNSVWWNITISKKATFELLNVWVNKNINPKEMIVINQRRNFGFVPSKKSAEIVRKFVPGFYQRSSNVIGDSYPSNVRDVIYIEAIDKSYQVENVEYMINTQPVKYVIVSYLYKNSRLQLEKKANIKLIKHFSPTGNIIYDAKIPEALFDAPYFMPLFQLERVGPYIDIFAVN